MSPGVTTQSLLRLLNDRWEKFHVFPQISDTPDYLNTILFHPRFGTLKSWVLEHWPARHLTPWLVNRPENIQQYENFPDIYKELMYTQPYKRQTLGFMDLPSELRLVVYQNPLRSDRPFELWSDVWESYNMTGDQLPEYKTVLHVLRLSKQIRNEAAAVFWGENEFRMSAFNDSVIVCDTFFYTIGDFNVRFLRKLTLGFPDGGFYALIGALRTFHRLANDGGVDLKELQLLYSCDHLLTDGERNEHGMYWINRLKESIQDLHISLILYHRSVGYEQNERRCGHANENLRASIDCRENRKANAWMFYAALDLGWTLRESYGLGDEHGEYTVNMKPDAIVDDTVTRWYNSYSASDYNLD